MLAPIQRQQEHHPQHDSWERRIRLALPDIEYRFTFAPLRPWVVTDSGLAGRLAVERALAAAEGPPPDRVLMILLSMTKPNAARTEAMLAGVDSVRVHRAPVGPCATETLVAYRGEEALGALHHVHPAPEPALSERLSEMSAGRGALLVLVGGGAGKSLRTLSPERVVAATHVRIDDAIDGPPPVVPELARDEPSCAEPPVIAFDVHAPIVVDGEIDETSAALYREQLIDAFRDSPEWAELDEDVTAVGLMFDYGLSYLGKTPATLSVASLREIVFELFPRKVMLEADLAGAVVDELRAFWRFAERAFGLPQARICFEALGGDARDRLARALRDPSCFGIAKGFFASSRALGFDITTEEGIQRAMAYHNAAGQADVWEPRAMSMGASPSDARRERNARKARRRKRQLQRQSRKRSR